MLKIEEELFMSTAVQITLIICATLITLSIIGGKSKEE